MAEFIEMTDERMQEMANKFGITVEEVREQWEIAQSQGPEAILDEMDGHLAEVEAEVEEVVVTIEVGAPERFRQMANLYQDLVDAMDAGTEPNVADLLLKVAVLLYRLREAEVEVDRLRGLVTGTLDGNRRTPKPQ